MCICHSWSWCLIYWSKWSIQRRMSMDSPHHVDPHTQPSHRPILGSFIPRLSPIQRQSFWNSLLSSTSSIFFPCYWVTLIYIKICYFSDIKKSPLLTQFSLWMSIPLFCSSMEKKILKFIYLSFLVLPMFSLKFIPTGLAGWQLHWNCSC